MHATGKSIWINRPPEVAFDLHADHASRLAWHEHASRVGDDHAPARGSQLFGWFILKFGLERHVEMAVRELEEEMEKV